VVAQGAAAAVTAIAHIAPSVAVAVATGAGPGMLAGAVINVRLGIVAERRLGQFALALAFFPRLLRVSPARRDQHIDLAGLVRNFVFEPVV